MLYSYAPYGLYPFLEPVLWFPIAGPFWAPVDAYPGYAPNFDDGYGKGKVELRATPKGAKIYIDGAYAGTAERLRNFWLDPGAYDLAVTFPGEPVSQERIYVLSGKTLKIAANELLHSAGEEKP